MLARTIPTQREAMSDHCNFGFHNKAGEIVVYRKKKNILVDHFTRESVQKLFLDISARIGQKRRVVIGLMNA